MIYFKVDHILIMILNDWILAEKIFPNFYNCYINLYTSNVYHRILI